MILQRVSKNLRMNTVDVRPFVAIKIGRITEWFTETVHGDEMLALMNRYLSNIRKDSKRILEIS